MIAKPRKSRECIKTCSKPIAYKGNRKANITSNEYWGGKLKWAIQELINQIIWKQSEPIKYQEENTPSNNKNKRNNAGGRENIEKIA